VIAALAAALWAAAPALEVVGDSTCPAPSEVARRLAELATANEATRTAESTAARVVVTHDGAALRLVLLGPNANELAARELAPEGTCDDLAAAAAVVVAAWQADLDPNLAPGVRLPARPEPLVDAPTPIVVATRAPPPASPARFDAGLGFLVSDVDGNLAPGAMVTGSLGRGALGLEASLLGATARTASVGALGSVATWTRFTLAAGPAWQPRRGLVRVDLHAQGLVGVLHVGGRSLTNPGTDTSAQLGAGAGGRLGLVAGTSSAWLGLDVFAWPGTQRLVVTNDPAEGRLARLELVASLGVSLGRFP
jgi:hypothetical protein